MKGEGGTFIGIEGFGSRCKGLGAFVRVYDTRGMHPVARFFLLGFFAQNVTFGRTDFFSALTSPQSTPMNFFVFQNPVVCYFAHIASIAENKNFEICVFRGHHARIFLYFKVPWPLRYVSVKSVQIYHAILIGGFVYGNFCKKNRPSDCV